MIAISIICPYCQHTRIQEFDDDYMKDPAFAGVVDEQPWETPCDACYAEFAHHEEAYLDSLYEQDCGARS